MLPVLVVEMRRLHRSALWQLRLTSQLLTLVEKSDTLKGDSSAGKAGNEKFLNRVGAGSQLDLVEEYQNEICAATEGEGEEGIASSP